MTHRYLLLDLNNTLQFPGLKTVSPKLVSMCVIWNLDGTVPTMHNFFKQPALQQTVVERPATAKPRDPDSYDFKDEQLAKDYRKMYDRYNEMEEMMKAQSIGDDNERGTSD